jgi:urease accessory protein
MPGQDSSVDLVRAGAAPAAQASQDFGNGRGDWRFWQILDSAFPTGGYAHSGGLEAAQQLGEVRNRTELESFVEASLWQAGRTGCPFLGAARAEPLALDELDRACDVFINNTVANRASRAQGRSLRAAANQVFGVGLPEVPYGHWVIVLGALAAGLDWPVALAHDTHLYFHLRGLLASAVRLNLVGPMEGQRWQFRWGILAQEIARACATPDASRAVQTAPLLDLWQGNQPRLYSRLFQS